MGVVSGGFDHHEDFDFDLCVQLVRSLENMRRLNVGAPTFWPKCSIKCIPLAFEPVAVIVSHVIIVDYANCRLQYTQILTSTSIYTNPGS